MPLPPSDGLAPRVAGVHVYGSDVPVTPHVMEARGARVGKMLPGFLENFPEIWNEQRDEIVDTIGFFEQAELIGKSPAELWAHLVDWRAMNKRWWEIHFEPDVSPHCTTTSDSTVSVPNSGSTPAWFRISSRVTKPSR